MFIKNNPT